MSNEMNKEEFIKLTIADKTEFLLNYSEVISEKVYYECNITLFLVEDFYVEVFFNREQNIIVSIEIQENNQILFEYVKNLDLNEIVKLLH
ncbi:MAG: hypothetical protein Q8T03_06870 [Bacteroidota bacterium]|nr:hypothetical protein [Bacteroidota bacterium]MDP3557079.1 hypothetical protein [Bacteroidota bacterium]